MIKITLYFWILFVTFSCADKGVADDRPIELPYYSDATFTPHWFKPNSDSIAAFHKISPFTLYNQDGDTITNQTFEGKIYVTDFFFTVCPGICPKMTANMAILQDSFLHDEEVLLLSHSVTPEKDSVSVLKEYAEEKGIVSSKWHIVTGSRNSIYKLGRRDYFVEEDLGVAKDLDEFLHTENFVLIDQSGHIRGIYNGLNSTSINNLVTDIKLLKTRS